MEILQKWLSRKVIIVMLTAVVNILVASGTIDEKTKQLLLYIITFLGGGYITIEGIADIITRWKKTY